MYVGKFKPCIPFHLAEADPRKKVHALMRKSGKHIFTARLHYCENLK
jgi:hypothetical protein